MSAKELKQHIADTYGLQVGQVFTDGGGVCNLHWFIKLYSPSDVSYACITYFGGGYMVSTPGGFLSGEVAIATAKYVDIAGRILESGILNDAK